MGSGKAKSGISPCDPEASARSLFLAGSAGVIGLGHGPFRRRSR